MFLSSLSHKYLFGIKQQMCATAPSVYRIYCWKPPILLPNKSFVRSKVRFPLFLLCKNCNFWATANTVWARNLKFGHSTLLVTLQKSFFFVFWIFDFFQSYAPFCVFVYIFFVNLSASYSQHRLSQELKIWT